MNVLRKLVFTFLICFLVKTVFSQQQYYIYIQSEEQQEFYVRMGSGIFNSSGSGYLVIPGLEKNTHEIIIGFPGKKEPEWRFNCTITETDIGFVLKAKGRDGVQLLSLKQKEGVMGTVVEYYPIKKDNDVPLPGTTSNDPFSSMLADVVNDPTIRQQLVIVEKETVPAVAIDDSAKALHTSVSVPTAQTPVNKEENKVALESPPLVTGMPAQTGPDTATTVAVGERSAPFVVKEIEKTNSVQSAKSSKAGATEKAGNTLAANTEKKYEPFVLREIHQPTNTETEKSLASGTEKKEDSVTTAPLKESEPFVVKEIGKNDIPKTTASAKTGIEKSTDSKEETKYLPFVIKPVDKKNNPEDKTAKSETEKRADTAEMVAEKKAVPLIIKKEDKAITVEKEKPARPVAGKKDKDSTSGSMKEKQSPVDKKAILTSVRKTLERKSREGTDLIYVDENAGGAKDTIRIFIPVVQ